VIVRPSGEKQAPGSDLSDEPVSSHHRTNSGESKSQHISAQVKNKSATMSKKKNQLPLDGFKSEKKKGATSSSSTNARTI
jgi:hypothetical protein